MTDFLRVDLGVQTYHLFSHCRGSDREFSLELSVIEQVDLPVFDMVRAEDKSHLFCPVVESEFC
jgi:hypothetical protein